MILASVRQGLASALAAPRLTLWIWIANLLFAFPMASMMAATIHEATGDTLVADRLGEGFDTAWHGEFQSTARGVDATFGPGVTGAAPFLRNLEGWLTGDLFDQPAGLLGLGFVWLLAWQLMQGGVLDGIIQRRDRMTLGRFLGAGGRYFFRFVRLALISVPVYFLVYRLGRWAYDRLGDLTRDVTSEREVMVQALLVLGAGALLLIVSHLAFTYAKIATVVEDRRSMLLALLRGIGFVLSHPPTVLAVYGCMALLWVAALAIYVPLAPGASGSTAWSVVLAFLGAQLFLGVKIFWRVALIGAQTALYRTLST